ncbi:MAG: MFS transporter [Candidatus Thorarchaeota archaeon]
MIEIEKKAEEDNTQTTPTQQPSRKLKTLIYFIASLSTNGDFIAESFVSLYAVFIQASAIALSLITSLKNLFQQVFQFSFGRLSDIFGRKILMIIGLITAGISIALFPLIHNQWVLVAGIIFYSIGFASYTPSFAALQGDITTKKNRAGWLSLLTIIAAFATIIGLLIVGFSSDLGSNEYQQFVIILEIAAGVFISGGIIAVFIYEPPKEKLTQRQPFSFKPIKENPIFRRLMIINSIMAFTMALGWPIFPYVRKEFATQKENSWMWAIFCVFQIIVLIAMRKSINKVRRKPLIVIGRILMFYIPLNLAINVIFQLPWWHLAISNALSGASNALYNVGLKSYILDLAPDNERGTYNGQINFFTGISTFLGSLIMGLIADPLIAKFDMWNIITILLFVITGARIIAGCTLFLIKEPQEVYVEKTGIITQ